MKKLIFLLILFFTGMMTYGQSTRVMESNLTLKKTSPTFYLQGSGANINFNNDLSFTQSSNRLTLSGGNLDLGSNNLYTTGQIGTLLSPASTIFTGILYSANLYGIAGLSTIGETGNRFLKGWFTDVEITNTPTIGGVAMPVANWNTAYTDRLKWDGGSTGLVAATGRTSLGATTVGSAFFTLTNPLAITFPRINDDNTVTALSAAAFTTAIGASHVYSDTMSLSAGVLRTKVTTITTEPYSVQIFTSGGSDITHAVSDSIALDGGVYKLYVYSVDALSGCKIKILY